MKTYEGAEVNSTILILGITWREKSVSRSYRFIHRGLEPWILGHRARSLVAIPAELWNMSTKGTVRYVGRKLRFSQIQPSEESSSRARCLWSIRFVSQLSKLLLYGHLSLEMNLASYYTIQLSFLLFSWIFRDIPSIFLFHQLWFSLVL
jgi:hypothetical protein